MKFQIIPLLATLALASTSFAASFDTDGFGSRLNGWQKNRTTTYSFTDAKYRTHVPTVTYSPSGSMFLSTRIDMLSSVGNGAICQMHLTFSSSGSFEAGQIKGTINCKSFDTGLVRRPEVHSAPAPAEGATAPPPPALNATDELIAEVFISFDGEMKRLNDAKAARKDLFSRLSGSSVKSADLSAGLRHNLNLILQNVSR